MKAVSLFSGVGGFEIGFDRAGIETILQAETDRHCRSVLERHWAKTERIEDVREYRRGSRARGRVDLVYGGFPCQPFSVAGRSEGNRDGRNLWPEFRRVVQELQPRWVVAENVPGLLSFDGGRFFGSILNDLGDIGFNGIAYAILDAQHFGVPQRRRRVFIVAGPSRQAVEQILSICESCEGHPAESGTTGEEIAEPPDDSSQNGSFRTTDLDNQEACIPDVAYAIAAREAKGVSLLESQTNYIPEASQVRRLTPLECERLMGWPDDWTRRGADGKEISDTHRYRMIGNGVVAPVAEWIGHRLVAVDRAIS
jgi:DNA (cytosine-5)-methyltransferase 1